MTPSFELNLGACSFLPLFCAHNVIELQTLRPYQISSRKRTANVMPFPFPPRTFFIIFSNGSGLLLSPLSHRSSPQPSLELAPFRKAGAKVEAFSLSARGRSKFFEKYFTCFYYAVPMIITRKMIGFCIEKLTKKRRTGRI